MDICYRFFLCFIKLRKLYLVVPIIHQQMICGASDALLLKLQRNEYCLRNFRILIRFCTFSGLRNVINYVLFSLLLYFIVSFSACCHLQMRKHGIYLQIYQIICLIFLPGRITVFLNFFLALWILVASISCRLRIFRQMRLLLVLYSVSVISRTLYFCAFFAENANLRPSATNLCERAFARSILRRCRSNDASS